MLRNSIYNYSPPSGIDYFSTTGSPLFNQQSFVSLADGEVAYLLYDASSAESGGDPWKAIQLHIDNTAEDPSSNITRTTYVKELGASNNGLTAISGTVETFFGSDTITGSGTSFTTNFSVGDFIKVSSESAAGTEVASSEYREIVDIFSNTAMTVKFPFLRTQSGVYGFKQALVPDISKDVILAEISRSGSVYSADIYVQTGGEDGASSDIVFLRSATAPDAPDDSSGVPNSPAQWYTNPPSGTDLLWASKGLKAVGETLFGWGTPYQVEGTAVAEIAVYKVNDSTTPTGGSYNFTTNSLTTTGLTAGWSQTPPSLANNSDSVYKSVALFVGGPEETAATATWTTPAVSAFRQDGSIGNDAKAVKLTPSSFVINYSTAGAESDSITFTTSVQSISGSPNYRFLVDGVEKQNLTTPTFTLADADEPAIGGVKEVKVEVYDTTTSPDTLLATDTVSIYAVQDGSDAIMGFLTNNAHTVSADNSGAVSSFTGSGGTFKVFVGGTDVTTSCTFSVSGTPSNITTGIVATTGVYSITALSADIANVTYQAVIPAATAGTAADVTITAIYSISKSKKGDVGDDGASLDIIFQRSSSSPATPTASSGTPSGWDTNPPAGTDTLWASQGVKAVGATNYTWSAPYQIEGTSVAEVYIYRKDSSAGASGGSYNFTTNTLTAPTSWSLSPPALTADGEEVYVAVGLFSGAPTATAATTTWSTPVVYAQRTDGISADVDIIFKRSSSSPATPTASPGVPTSEGWGTNPPAGTNTLWASNGTKEGGATNYTWSAPYQIEGTSVAEVYIYRKDSSAGASGGSYNFTTNTLTAPTSWSLSPPALTADGEEVYVAVGLFSGAPTATAATTTWSTPVVYAQRTDGISADVDIIFKRSSSNPGAPTASPGVPTSEGWGTSPPAGTNTLWASNGTKEGGATNYTWSAPYQIEGTSVAEVYIYRKDSSAGASGGSYNFTTNTLTAPTNWSLAPPALTADGEEVYVAVGLFSGAPTATAATTTWSTPVVYAERQDGTSAVSLNLTASPVLFTKDANGTYDPDSTSTIALSAFGGSITKVTWSTSAGTLTGAGEQTSSPYLSSNTLTFGNNQSLANAKASATVTAVVEGTNSKGATVSFGTITAKIATTIQGEDGATGPSGFLYYLSGDTSTDVAHITATSPATGQIAIVENTAGDQAGYRYSGSAWVSKDLINTGIIVSNAITATQLEISDSTGTGTGIFMDGGNNSIKIYQGTTLRVRIGNLVD